MQVLQLQCQQLLAVHHRLLQLFFPYSQHRLPEPNAWHSCASEMSAMAMKSKINQIMPQSRVASLLQITEAGQALNQNVHTAGNCGKGIMEGLAARHIALRAEVPKQIAVVSQFKYLMPPSRVCCFASFE